RVLNHPSWATKIDGFESGNSIFRIGTTPPEPQFVPTGALSRVRTVTPSRHFTARNVHFAPARRHSASQTIRPESMEEDRDDPLEDYGGACGRRWPGRAPVVAGRRNRANDARQHC